MTRGRSKRPQRTQREAVPVLLLDRLPPLHRVRPLFVDPLVLCTHRVVREVVVLDGHAHGGVVLHVLGAKGKLLEDVVVAAARGHALAAVVPLQVARASS